MTVSFRNGTADGHLLAFHDLRLDRVTDGTGRIAELTLADVQRARINGSEPVPLLSDLLEEFPDVRLNIDVKAPGAIEPLARVLRDLGAAHCLVDRDEARFGILRADAAVLVRRALGAEIPLLRRSGAVRFARRVEADIAVVAHRRRCGLRLQRKLADVFGRPGVGGAHCEDQRNHCKRLSHVRNSFC